MTLLRSFPIMTIALVVLSMVGFAATTGSVELLLIAVTLAALSWYVTEGPRGRTLPQWVSNILVLAVSLTVLIDLMMPPNDILLILGRFSVWLALIKLYERRTARDHAHLMGLSLLLMLIASLRSTSLLFGVVLLLYATLGLYVLLLYQLYRAQERVAAEQRARADDRATTTAPLAQPTLGRHHVRHFRGLAVAIGTVGLTLSVFVFLIFPRNVGHGVFGDRDGRERTTGYAEEIDLIGGTRITASPREVLTFALTNEDGSAPSVVGPLRLRGAVLDRYQDGRWSTSRREQRHLLAPSETWTSLLPDAVEDADAMPVQTFGFREGTKTIFALGAADAVRLPGASRIVHDPALETVRVVPGEAPLWNYEARGDADSNSVRVPKWAPPALGYLSAPESSVERVRDLAGRLLREAGVPERAPADDSGAWSLQAARIFARHLQSGAYRYTLDLRDVVVRDRDPVAAFLFDTRRGHCEFFASALAALCHAVDADARVIAGYRVGAIDASTGHYRVRAADAHAWVEVRSALDRYTAVDPTPPAAIAPRMAEADRLLDRLGLVYQRLEGSWAQRVIAFDDLTQARLMASIEGGWSTWFRRQWRVLSGWAAQINRAFYLGPAGYIWMGLVAFAVGVALVALARGVRRMRRLRSTLRTERLESGVSRRLVRQLGFYLDMLEVLRATGVPKPAWQPPLAFADALAERHAPGAAVVHELTELFYRGRYGGHALDRNELRRARELIGRLAAERGASRS